MTHLRFLLAVLVFSSVSACGGGGDGKPNDDDGPNAAPTAAFTASAATVTAGDALSFDASSSSDPDGDELTFSWSFGSGGRGGTERIAHVFSTVGTQEVTLTVSDGRDKHTATQTITVIPGPTPVGSAATNVRVIAPSLQPIEGATVRLVGGASATTDATGNATLAIGTGVRQVIRVEAAGFTRRTHVANLKDAATAGYLEIVMQPLGAAQVLADAAAGGTVEVDGGAKVTIAGRSLVGASGSAVTGAVDVFVSPVDVTKRPRAFPGEFVGRGTDGTPSGIASYGTVDFNFTKDGEKLDLAPGETATIEVPVFPALDLDGNPVGLGKVIPLWSLDEDSGQWIREGEGAIYESASSPTGFVQRATVGHFSWWNCDDVIGPTQSADVGCCLDTDDDGDCDAPSPCFITGRTCAAASCDDDSYNVPLYGPSTSVDSDASESLLIPTQMHLALEAYGPDGLTRGRYISAAGAAVPQSIQIALAAFVPPPPDEEPIMLPFDFTTAVEAAPTVYEVDLDAGTSLYVSASRAGGSTLTGRVRLLSPTAEELENKTFGTSAGVFIEAIPVDGRYLIEVSGISPTPTGTYRLQIRTVGDDMSVVSVTPANGSTVDPPSSITVTFSRPPKASSVNSTTFNLFGPTGEVAPVTGGITVSGLTATFATTGIGSGFTYTVQLTTGIMDDLNNAITAPFESTFATNDTTLAFGRAVAITGMDSAMANDGTALVVGVQPTQFYGQANQVLFTRYVPGTGWSAPAALPQPAAGVYSGALVAMSDDGIALATYRWSSNGNAPYVLYAVSYTPSTGWGEYVAIPTDGSTISTTSPGTIAVDAAGRAIRTWPGDSNTAWYSWFNGTEWSAATDLDGGQFYSSGNEGTTVNADGRGGTMWRNNYNLIARRFDTATGVLGAVVDLGNNQSGRREIQVDGAGNLFLLRVDGSGLSHVHRLPYDTVGESAYSFQIEGAVNAANCPPDLAVSPTGKTAFVFCKSGPQPYVQHWDGDPSHAAGTALLLQGTSNARRTRIAAANEDFVVVFSRSVVDVVYMRRSIGDVWEETNTTLPALEAVIDQDQLIGSEHGEVIYVRYDGFVGRLR